MRFLVHSINYIIILNLQQVVREPSSKWYLSSAEFPDDYFPTYCSGSAFVLTPDVAADMYTASLRTPFFWVDDYYVTGLLASLVGVKHVNFNSVYTLHPKTFLTRFTTANVWKTLIIGHVHDLTHMKIVWKNVLRDRLPVATTTVDALWKNNNVTVIAGSKNGGL